MKTSPAIALGTWSTDSGLAGCYQVFGNHSDVKSLEYVFDAPCHADLRDTYPIIGIVKPRYVEEGNFAAKIKLTNKGLSFLEALAEATGVDTKSSWKKTMI